MSPIAQLPKLEHPLRFMFGLFSSSVAVDKQAWGKTSGPLIGLIFQPRVLLELAFVVNGENSLCPKTYSPSSLVDLIELAIKRTHKLLLLTELKSSTRSWDSCLYSGLTAVMSYANFQCSSMNSSCKSHSTDVTVLRGRGRDILLSLYPRLLPVVAI